MYHVPPSYLEILPYSWLATRMPEMGYLQLLEVLGTASLGQSDLVDECGTSLQYTV